MSIERLRPITDYNSVWVVPDPDGEYVTYADHVAEVERLRDELLPALWNRAEQLETARVNGWHAGWNAATDDMRAACIAAVEEVPVRGTWTAYKVIEETLKAIREVQP